MIVLKLVINLSASACARFFAFSFAIFLALLAENNEKKFDELSDQERFARIDAVMGMFAHIPGSVDDFMMEKQKDIEVENRRWKEKE